MKIQSWFSLFILSFLALLSSLTQAQNELLSADAAFPIQVQSLAPDRVSISWGIPENYYLYQHKIEVQQQHQALQLELPPSQAMYDENYGHTQVYYQHLTFQIPSQPLKNYQVSWQGCAKDRICYPPQQINFTTDVNGLVQFQTAKHKLDLLQLNQENQAAEQATLAHAQDQQWLDRLNAHPFIYSLLLFFGLGMLLAFTPCSLPMLPILTSLIVRDRRGLQAGWIALVFVLAMASVYALLGLLASAAGLNFQRWLQQPVTLMLFAGLFIVFALNLFGLFELKLPSAWVNRLDRLQAMQRGGTLLGAALMGAISALLVGPCMTAPLAGALLFISQNQNQLQGSMLLFSLGLGMGTPLLLASILGAHVLPQAGQWMQHVRYVFAFLMLGLALYFVRPLLNETVILLLGCVLSLSFFSYMGYQIYHSQARLRIWYIALLLIVAPITMYVQVQPLLQQQQTNHQQNTWHVAKTAAEFKALLAQAPQQNIVIDVYADWCVACQPIEKRVLRDSKVQQALSNAYLIKLDLSDYDASHAILLKEWQILGPPTFLFLNSKQQEQRHLRLTGSFSSEDLLSKLKALE